ncbi:hypothetical protein G1K75_09510 [Tenacibaculum finnmarkense]|uniref:hypothetical protein n=1 Tax=Tenacibaculum finnmarkense TaxID=2781243 RepID=UPI001EFA9A85|nr:hypothetical protein [Tenacibaculum finnmarkense]MCG8805892.1 hypothetical protein [Tenacibaculum finnmarkense]
MLRKLIVKYFALSYITKIFGKEIYMLRGATPLSIFLSLSAIGGILEIDYLLYIGLFLFGVSVYFGFIYFRNSKNSIKWKELDDVQKRIYYNIGIGFIDMLKSKEGYSLDNQKVHNSPIFLIINIVFLAAPPIITMIV